MGGGAEVSNCTALVVLVAVMLHALDAFSFFFLPYFLLRMYSCFPLKGIFWKDSQHGDLIDWKVYVEFIAVKDFIYHKRRCKWQSILQPRV